MSQSSIEIRELKPGEWKIYRDIRLEALKNEPLAFISAYSDVLKRTEESWRDGLIRTTNPNSFILFAFKNSKAVGLMGTYQKDDDNHLGIINMFTVYVRPKYRGTGVTQELMTKIIKESSQIPGIKKIRLAVHYDQISAQRFYKSVGFKKYGEDPSRNRYLMELEITNI